MGLRIWRRLTVVPGLGLNLSKNGISASVGTRGAWYTVGSRGSRATFGIPGTGIFWTEQLNSKVAPRPQPPHAGHQVSFVIFLLAVVVAIIALHGVP